MQLVHVPVIAVVTKENDIDDYGVFKEQCLLHTVSVLNKPYTPPCIKKRLTIQHGR
jgi:hypothetical protein